MARATTDSGKVMVQVRFTPAVYERIERMAEQRGMTPAAYTAFAGSELSLTHLQFANAIGNLSLADNAHDGGADETP